MTDHCQYQAQNCQLLSRICFCVHSCTIGKLDEWTLAINISQTLSLPKPARGRPDNMFCLACITDHAQGQRFNYPKNPRLIKKETETEAYCPADLPLPPPNHHRPIHYKTSFVPKATRGPFRTPKERRLT